MAIIMSNVNMAAKDYKAKSKLQIEVKLIKRIEVIFFGQSYSLLVVIGVHSMMSMNEMASRHFSVFPEYLDQE